MQTGDDRMDGTLRALAGSERAPPPPLSPELEAALGAMRPVRTRTPARDLALAAGASMVCAALVLAIGTPRRDLSELPLPWLIWFGACWLGAFGAIYTITVRPRSGEIMPRSGAALVTATAAATALIALAATTAQHAPSSRMPPLELDTFFRHALPCWFIAIVTAIGPVVLGIRALRGAVPVGAPAVAFALGAAGGALGGLVLHLHCPIAHWGHVSLTHGVGTLMCGAITATIAPRWLRP